MEKIDVLDHVFGLLLFLYQYQTKHALVYVYKHITQVQFHFYGVIQMPFWYTFMDDLVLV